METHQNLLECAEQLQDPSDQQQQHQQHYQNSIIPQQIHELFTQMELLGKGAFGEVYRAVKKATGEVFAIKISQKDVSQSGLPSNVYHEIQAMKALSHPNIVKLEDINVFLDFPIATMSLILEICNCDLAVYLDKIQRYNQKLSKSQVQSIIKQILLAVEFCHQKRFAHLDLKPQNVLIKQLEQQDQLQVKVADFGLAKLQSIPLVIKETEVVTLWYRAPELLLGFPIYSFPVDVWSIGCILAELATKRPFFGKNQMLSRQSQLNEIIQIMGNLSVENWPELEDNRDYHSFEFPECQAIDLNQVPELSDVLGDDGIDLLKQMLTYNPQHRINCSQALQHAFVRDVKI